MTGAGSEFADAALLGSTCGVVAEPAGCGVVSAVVACNVIDVGANPPVGRRNAEKASQGMQ